MASAQTCSRRRFLHIAAGLGSLSLLREVGAFPTESSRTTVFSWRSILMGAETSISIGGIDHRQASAIVQDCALEAQRLEKLFSLQVRDSTIARLNATGALAEAPAEFLELLMAAQRISQLTNGAFDATVQPLWLLYRAHFAGGGDPAGPAASMVKKARALVDYRQLTIANRALSFAQPGMALTLNGIAQGYITDRIANLLRAHGLEHVLVDMGEHYALGGHPAGRAWNLGIRDPRDPLRVVAQVPLADMALSTSGGYGLCFDSAGRFHHLFDPRTGSCAARYLGVSVRHPRATVADGLSTAFCAMPLSAIRQVVESDPSLQVWVVMRDGSLTVLGNDSNRANV